MDKRYEVTLKRVVFFVLTVIPQEWIDEAIDRLMERSQKEKNKG